LEEKIARITPPHLKIALQQILPLSMLEKGMVHSRGNRQLNPSF